MLAEEFHKPRPPAPGYVYLMRNGRGHFKIGHSIHPRKRRSQLSSQRNPVRIILLIPTRDMIALETELQRQFILKRIAGEWYRLDNSDINDLIQTKGAVRYNPATFDWKAWNP